MNLEDILSRPCIASRPDLDSEGDEEKRQMGTEKTGLGYIGITDGETSTLEAHHVYYI